SRVVGQATRDAMIIAATSGLGAWAQWLKNPFLYELGSTTVSTSVWSAMQGMSTLDRGAYLWTTYGMRGFALGAKATGEFTKTIPEGLTPGAALLLVGLAESLDSFGNWLYSPHDKASPPKK